MLSAAPASCRRKSSARVASFACGKPRIIYSRYWVLSQGLYARQYVGTPAQKEETSRRGQTTGSTPRARVHPGSTTPLFSVAEM